MSSTSTLSVPLPVVDADVPLDRDRFLRTLLRELAGVLEEVVGLEETSGLVSVVAQRMGSEMDRWYREALGVERLDLHQVADVMVDLKHRIEGGFSVHEVSQERITLVNDRCPFGEHVLDRPASCMMTSNVFGVIAAGNLGYARVELKETIAEGDGRCLVVVHLQDDRKGGGAEGREYFGRAP